MSRRNHLEVILGALLLVGLATAAIVAEAAVRSDATATKFAAPFR